MKKIVEIPATTFLNPAISLHLASITRAELNQREVTVTWFVTDVHPITATAEMNILKSANMMLKFLTPQKLTRLVEVNVIPYYFKIIWSKMSKTPQTNMVAYDVVWAEYFNWATTHSPLKTWGSTSWSPGSARSRCWPAASPESYWSTPRLG